MYRPVSPLTSRSYIKIQTQQTICKATPPQQMEKWSSCKKKRVKGIDERIIQQQNSVYIKVTSTKSIVKPLTLLRGYNGVQHLTFFSTYIIEAGYFLKKGYYLTHRISPVLIWGCLFHNALSPLCSHFIICFPISSLRAGRFLNCKAVFYSDTKYDSVLNFILVENVFCKCMQICDTNISHPTPFELYLIQHPIQHTLMLSGWHDLYVKPCQFEALHHSAV